MSKKGNTIGLKINTKKTKLLKIGLKYDNTNLKIDRETPLEMHTRFIYPPYFCRALKVRQQPPSGKTTKITNHCSPSLSHSSFSPPLEYTPSLCSILFFPPGLKNICSPPPLIVPHPNPQSFLPPLIHPKPTSFKFPAFLPESPCNVHVHLGYYMFPAPIPLPATDLMSLFPTVWSFPLPPLLSHAPLAVRCVLALT